ncbi:MAG: hypothetical protein HKN03_10530 [Acidimicrobiales bacterium]|nr:hypothetical protein [Acidimicrobiales bacterium]
MSSARRRAVYPGSFNPPTIAHLDLSQAVIEQRSVDVVVWSISRVALGKESHDGPTVEERFVVMNQVAKEYPWLEIQVTDAQLLADIAQGFDVLIMGADKWEQINELQWYGGDSAARDAALAALPELAIASRQPHVAPAEYEIQLEGVELVSSSAARAGAHHLMLPHARASGLW